MEHYYVKKPKCKLKYYKLETNIQGFEVSFSTCSGIFSPRRVDPGTRLLAEKMNVRGDILDLGCGYGVLGIIAKKTSPKSMVYMSDINERAVRMSLINLKLNDVKAIVKQGYLYGPFKGKKFDVIVVNPPITAGRKLCFEIIERAKDYLKPKGILQTVARHKKGGKILMEKMEEVFGNVNTLGKKAGYRVYLSKKS